MGLLRPRPTPAQVREQLATLVQSWTVDSMAVAVTGANVQDRDGGQLVLKGLKDRFPRLARVWADGVYAGRLVD